MSGLVGLDGSPLVSDPPPPPAPPAEEPPPTAPEEPPAAAAPPPSASDAVSGEPAELGAVRKFYEAITQGKSAEEVVGALDAALQRLAAAHVQRFPDNYLPQLGTDYQISYAAPPAPGEPPAVLIEDLTPAGALLGEIWNTYQREVEYAALKTHVARLTGIVEQLVGKIQAMGNQLDNAMMDFNKIRRKIKA